MKVPWTEHKTNEEILQMVETERKIMDTVAENNVRRTNTGEEGLRETKNNAFGLAIEDRGRQYQLPRTKDVRPGPIQMESMKMETCHMAEHYRERERSII